MVFVDDVAAAYEAAVLRPPDGAHAFSLPGPTATTDEIVAAIQEQVPDARITVDGPALPFPPDIDEGDLRAVFPGLPNTSLRDGIAATIGYYRSLQESPNGGH